MPANNWTYTAAERRTIDKAYAAICYAVDHAGHGCPSALRDALRHERRERSSVTVAKALLIRGFMDGRTNNPTAADLAYHSAGIVTATILGARSRGAEHPADTLAELDTLAAAAAAAHESYMARGLAAARESIGNATP